jgi:hypothetical protein
MASAVPLTLWIGLDGEDRATGIEEQFAEDSGAGTHVGDVMAGAQSELIGQAAHDFRGIARTVADVVGNSI